MDKIKVQVELCSKNAELPEYAHIVNGVPGDACMDIVAIGVEYNKEKGYYVYNTGLKFKMPEGVYMSIVPRSSIRNKNAFICNSPATIDWIYNKEVLICFRPVERYEDYASRLTVDFMSNVLMTSSTIDEIKSKISGFQKPLESEYIENNAPYKVGEKIAQLIIHEYKPIIFERVQNIEDSGRGGFGSSDKQDGAIL